MESGRFAIIKLIKTGGHTDERRTITDMELPKDLPFQVVQIKVIDFHGEGMVVGNHNHPPETGREEFFVVVGEPNKDLFEFRFRVDDGAVHSIMLENRDGVYVPLGLSHAFKVLQKNAQIWGYSNQPYDDTHDEVDVLFE